MDTRGPCESCDSRIGDRRGLRRAVALQVAEQHPHLTSEERKPIYEQELKDAFAAQVEHTARKFARDAQQREWTEQWVERERERQARQEAERAARPCTRCGVPDAGGLCPACVYDDNTRTLVGKAVDIVVALRVDPTDAQALAELAARVEQDTWAAVRHNSTPAASGEPGTGVCVAYQRFQRAQRLLAERQRKALLRLAYSPLAEGEYVHVYRMALRGMTPTEDVKLKADKAATKARWRVAHELMADYLGDLHRARAQAQAKAAAPIPSWAERLAERAAQECADDVAVQPAGAP